MCNFLSGVVTIEPHPRVLCGHLLHHEKTVELYKLVPETYREFEWLAEDAGESLTVRAAPGENPNVLKSAILASFPNRQACFLDCIRQVVAANDGALYASGTPLQSLGDMPALEYLDANGTPLQSLGDMPALKTLYASGTQLQSLGDMPALEYLYASGTQLQSAPNARCKIIR
jgi:Leucine-rich repeat (LRR) protein